jgi:predicted membrane protein
MSLPVLELSHFTAALVFAICASVVFGITQRNTPRDMVRYGAYCFTLFIVGVFVAGWVMWLLKH